MVKIDAERAKYWIGKGAQPSDTVRSLLKQQARRPRRRRGLSQREGAAGGARARRWSTSPTACASSEWTEDGVVHLDLEVARVRPRPGDRPRGPHRGRPAHAARRGGAPARRSSATWRSWTDDGAGLRRPGGHRPRGEAAGTQGRGRWCEPLSDRPDRFPSLRARLRARRRRAARARSTVSRCWPHKGRFVLKLEGVDSIDDAERCAAWSCASREEELAALPAGSYYHHQLKGLRVEDARRAARWARSRTSWRPGARRPCWWCAGRGRRDADPAGRGLRARAWTSRADGWWWRVRRLVDA